MNDNQSIRFNKHKNSHKLSASTQSPSPFAYLVPIVFQLQGNSVRGE